MENATDWPQETIIVAYQASVSPLHYALDLSEIWIGLYYWEIWIKYQFLYIY